MPHFVYGERWNPRFSMMLDGLSEDEARSRYEAGLEVSIACGVAELVAVSREDLETEGDQPAEWDLYTELSRRTRDPEQPNVASVRFYDFWGTRVATYYFNGQDDGRLFLQQVDEYDFADTTGQVDDYDWSVLTEHYFRPDGYSSTTVRRALPDDQQEVQRTEFAGGDFSTHWEPVPAWGDWASITRRDRSRPA